VAKKPRTRKAKKPCTDAEAVRQDTPPATIPATNAVPATTPATNAIPATAATNAVPAAAPATNAVRVNSVDRLVPATSDNIRGGAVSQKGKGNSKCQKDPYV
jgi:hypothetical protein